MIVNVNVFIYVCVCCDDAMHGERHVTPECPVRKNRMPSHHPHVEKRILIPLFLTLDFEFEMLMKTGTGKTQASSISRCPPSGTVRVRVPHSSLGEWCTPSLSLLSFWYESGTNMKPEFPTPASSFSFLIVEWCNTACGSGILSSRLCPCHPSPPS